MRILIYGLNFFPELTGIGKYTGELAKYLSEKGHDVKVITTPPYYPQWRVLAGYSGWRYLYEQWGNVKIIRCPLWVPNKPRGLTRILHLLSFAISSMPVMLSQLRRRPDIVINVAPTILTAFSAIIIARLAKSKAWLHIQDFELDAALELNILNFSDGFFSIAQKIEASIYTQFNCVSTISNRMLEHLREKGLSNKQIYVFQNWIDTSKIFPLDGDNYFRREFEINQGKIIVLYSGNMGRKQGLEILIRVAKILIDKKDILFVLCGDGAVRSELEEEAHGLTNVRFLPLQPVEKLNPLLNLADIHVLPQRSDAADLVMPSKLTGMLASGRPVIVTAHEDTELAQVVRDIGFVVPPEEPQALAEAILSLAKDKKLRTQLGDLGRNYAETHWSMDRVLGEFLHQMEYILGS